MTKCEHDEDIEEWEFEEENNRGAWIYSGHCNVCNKDLERSVTTTTNEEIYTI